MPRAAWGLFVLVFAASLYLIWVPAEPQEPAPVTPVEDKAADPESRPAASYEWQDVAPNQPEPVRTRDVECLLRVVVIDAQTREPWVGDCVASAAQVDGPVEATSESSGHVQEVRLPSSGLWRVEVAAWPQLGSPIFGAESPKHSGWVELEIALGEHERTVEVPVTLTPRVTVRVQAGDGLPLLRHPEFTQGELPVESLTATFGTKPPQLDNVLLSATGVFTPTAQSRRDLPADAIGSLAIDQEWPESISLWFGPHRLETLAIQEGDAEILFVIPTERIRNSLGTLRARFVDARTGELVRVVSYTLDRNAAGRFPEAAEGGDHRLTGILPGEKRLAVIKRGYMTSVHQVTIRPGEVHDLGEVRLSPTVAVVVDVRDARGQPYAANFLVGVRMPDGSLHFDDYNEPWNARSGDDGQMHINSLGPGTYSLHHLSHVQAIGSDAVLRARLHEINVPEAGPAHFSVLLEPATPVEINFASERIQAGHISFEHDGLPAGSIPVRANHPATAYLLPGTYNWAFQAAQYESEPPHRMIVASANGSVSVSSSSGEVSIQAEERFEDPKSYRR